MNWEQADGVVWKKKSENMWTVHISRQGPSFMLIKGAVLQFSSSLG